MGLRKTDYGYVCPVGRWRQYDLPGGKVHIDGGPTPAHLGDPETECFNCVFSLLDPRKTRTEDGSGWDWSKVCRCPEDMGVKEYIQLREAYRTSGEKIGQKSTFWEWVAKNRLPDRPAIEDLAD